MTRESKIGIFVLIGLVAMGYFVYRTSEVKKLLTGEAQNMREVEIRMEDASGMREGTSVEIAGVRVGKVRRIELDGDLAVAIIELPKSMSFKDGANAQIRSKGVLGERYIALHLGRGNELTDQDALFATTPPDLGEITSTVKTLADNLVEITENFKQSTVNDDGQNRIAAIASNIERLTAVLADMVAENRSNMSTTSTEIAQLTKSLNRDIPQLIAELTEFSKGLRDITAGNRGNIDKTINNLATLSENFESASASLSSIASKVDEGQGSLGKLINEPDTTDKLNEVLDNVNESLEQVKGLVNKANDIELDLVLRSEYLTEWQTTRTVVGMHIKPDENKYYMLEGVSLGDELIIPEFHEEEEKTYDADGNLISTTVRRWEDEPEDFVFNGQLAYRFGAVFLRGGLIESTGGGGMDWYSNQGRLKFSVEAFDFNRKDLSPHGRLDFRVNLTKNIHFNAGWDDFLESDRNSAAMGAGIRWKDEDLKLLFATLGRFM